MAFPGLARGPLNIRDIEQGLEQINRLPSWNAKVEVAPGAETGSSVVMIAAPEAALIHGRVGTDNSGDVHTGRTLGSVQLGLEDPLGLLDAWTAQYQRNIVDPGAAHFSNAM